MKVIQIIPRMNVGGTERGVLDLVCYFKDKDVESVVISGGGSLIKKLDKIGIKHYELPVFKKSPASILLIPKLRSILKKERPDIIHARSRVPAWISFFASRSLNAHFLTTAHGIYKSKLSSEVMGWGKYVICPSKIVARHMQRVFGISEEKINVISRWVDLD